MSALHATQFRGLGVSDAIAETIEASQRLAETVRGDTTPVPALTKDLFGKLFGGKGYLGQKLAQELLRRGLALVTRIRSNIKSLPVSFLDKALLNGRNIAETIIGHIKEFSSLRPPKHRSVFNAFTHITAAIIAYQSDPLPPRSIRVILP